MIVGAVGAVGSLSRLNLAMATMRASATRRVNMQASVAPMSARVRARRAVANLQRAEFISRLRAEGVSNAESIDTWA